MTKVWCVETKGRERKRMKEREKEGERKKEIGMNSEKSIGCRD